MKDLEKVFLELKTEDHLEKILVTFYKKMAQDVMLGFFFTGKDIVKIALQQKAFLLRAMGRAKSYQGQSPGAAHLKIPPILKGHFDRRLVLLRETLSEAGLSKESTNFWVNFEEQFRKSIVEEERPLSER